MQHPGGDTLPFLASLWEAEHTQRRNFKTSATTKAVGLLMSTLMFPSPLHPKLGADVIATIWAAVLDVRLHAEYDRSTRKANDKARADATH